METFFLQSHFNLNHKTVINKLCTQLHPAPSTSIQLILTSIQLHPPPPSLFQPPPSSLQHSQQYLNQNIARNWEIFPNLGQKLKKHPFDWKLAHMVYWRCWFQIKNFNPKIHFWANLGLKIQSFLFCLKIGTHSISWMLIPDPDLDFWNFDPKNLFFGKLWP